jgi:RNA polymerase sigma-70 factor (ECF subfamily)
MIVPHLSRQIDPLDLEMATNISGNIEKALMTLTEAQQHVIYLGMYYGFTQSEISKNLNIPIQTVNSKIRIALSSLRDNLLRGEE